MNPIIVESRLEELMNGGILDKGSHMSFTEGACAMEWVSYIAGLRHTDAPECVSPVLRTFTINLNDGWDTEQRQKLVPLLPRMVGTNGDGQDEARSYLALDWLIRTYTPAWLDLARWTEDARALRDLPQIADLVTAEQAGPVVCVVRNRADARWVATVDAARDAAWDAARYAATGDAAWYAAAIDARIAATDAQALRDLQPTVTMLQTSALELLDRMIDQPICQ